jgi:hypothetical protein
MGKDGFGWSPEKASETLASIDALEKVVAATRANTAKSNQDLVGAINDLSQRVDALEVRKRLRF